MAVHEISAHLRKIAEPKSEPVEIHIRKCRHGLMAYFPHDFYIGGALERYGEYVEGEAELLMQYVHEGDIVVEVGANIGCHTVPLAKLVTNSGRVFAFEPQRIIHQMLCGNLAINGIWNVIAERIALGEKPEIMYVPPIDYGSSGNFGGVSLVRSGGEPIQVQTIDQYSFIRCDLIKVDVEGMEADVIAGAQDTIRRLRPILYVENDRKDKAVALIEQLRLLGYDLYWHLPKMFNPDNFNKNEKNDYVTEKGELVSINMLGLPAEKKMSSPLQRVEINAGALQ